MSFPCERYLSAWDDAYFRAVDVHAPEHILLRWLCQLRAAPYSYDLIDNRGRQSPRRLIAGLEGLQVGQRVMGIFRLMAFEPDQHITLLLTTPRARAIFGDVVLSYVILM